jgi:hypothetical protein
MVMMARNSFRQRRNLIFLEPFEGFNQQLAIASIDLCPRLHSQ